MDYNNFDDFDEESQKMLRGMKLLNFDTLQDQIKSRQNDFYAQNNIVRLDNENFRRKNPLAYSPLSKTGDDVRDNFFGRSTIYSYPNFQVIVDPSSKIDPKDKIKPIQRGFYYDKNKNSLKDKNEPYLVTIKLFISKIADQLKEIYDDPTIKPNPKEILFFLEDNDADWSTATFYIKKGKDVDDNLTQLLANNNAFGNYIKSQYNISIADLQELLITGKVKNNLFDIMAGFFEFVSFFISNPVLIKTIATAIKSGIETIKETCTIDEKNWNPKKADQDFKPFFFPGVNAKLDKLDNETINNLVKTGVENLKKQMVSYDKKINTTLQLVTSVPLPIFLPVINIPIPAKIPDSFGQALQLKYHELRTVMDIMLVALENIDLSVLVKESLNALNAFICGIWNGFVEAVCGIISLVQYLFEGAEFIADLLKNFKEKAPEILEKIDDITLAFKNLDFVKIFTTLATNIKKWVLSASNISLVEIAYFSGMFIGLVVELTIEIVVGILFTGGTLTIESVLAKLGEAFKAIASLFTGIVKGLYKAGEKTLTSFLKSLEWLYEFLNKGTDEILRIMDEVVAGFKKVEELAIENFNKLKDKAKTIFSKETEYDALFRDITKKFLISDKGILTEKQFFKLAKKIEEAFNIEMLLVDRNSEKFAELFKKWQNSPVFAVFHEATFTNGRYGIVLDGPGIYFFKGRTASGLAVDLTSYTVQHELFHLKLWHKMVKEFPEMAELYRKIPRWLHEEDVIGNFMKNPEKWDMESIVYDLNYYNEYYLPPGEKPRTLEYFKNWKLEEHLKKI